MSWEMVQKNNKAKDKQVMSIEEAIELLKSEAENGNKSIILAYWTAEMFGKENGEEWDGFVDTVEDKMDWAMAHEEMSCIVNN